MPSAKAALPSLWQDELPPFPSDELPPRAAVLVVGGGLLGVCAAYWLARRGLAPLLVEQGDLAAGATGRNGGFLVEGTAEDYPAAVVRLGQATARAVWALTLENRALLRSVLADEGIDCDYRELGHLELALAEGLARPAATQAALRADGFVAELLDRRQAQELVATPLGTAITGGLLRPLSGLLHPAKLVHGLATAARRHGARICTQTEVLALVDEGGGLRVETQRGVLWAEAAVLAVNAWSARLVPALTRLIRPVRGQVLAYAPREPLFQVGMGCALTPTGEYWQQRPNGVIVLGGCRALAADREEGLLDVALHAGVQEGLEGVLPQLFPRLGALAVQQRWAGPMAFTPDYLPLVAGVPSLQRTWLVGGFSGHGMPFGMILGSLLSEAVEATTLPAALTLFSPERASLTSKAS